MFSKYKVYKDNYWKEESFTKNIPLLIYRNIVENENISIIKQLQNEKLHLFKFQTTSIFHFSKLQDAKDVTCFVIFNFEFIKLEWEHMHKF